MMLPCNPTSELGGYGLWKIMAALNRNEKPNIAMSSRVLLCLVVNHHHSRMTTLFSVENNLLLSQNTNPFQHSY